MCNSRPAEQVPIMNLIMLLQSILHWETKTPLMIWPSAAAGINTSPRGKQRYQQLHINTQRKRQNISESTWNIIFFFLNMKLQQYLKMQFKLP